MTTNIGHYCKTMLFDLFPLIPLSKWTPKVVELLVARKWKVSWIKRFPTIGAVPGTIIRDEDDNPLSFMEATNRLHVRADLKPDHLVTKRCPLLPWNSGVAAGVLVGPD